MGPGSCMQITMSSCPYGQHAAQPLKPSLSLALLLHVHSIDLRSWAWVGRACVRIIGVRRGSLSLSQVRRARPRTPFDDLTYTHTHFPKPALGHRRPPMSESPASDDPGTPTAVADGEPDLVGSGGRSPNGATTEGSACPPRCLGAALWQFKASISRQLALSGAWQHACRE